MDNRPKTPREHELMAERNYYRRALEEIARKDVPGGPFHEMATKALSGSCTCCHGATCPMHG